MIIVMMIIMIMSITSCLSHFLYKLIYSNFFLSFDYFLIVFQTPVDYSLIAFLFLMFLIAFLCSANIRKITFSPFPVSQRNISYLLLQQENIIQQYSDFQIQDYKLHQKKMYISYKKEFSKFVRLRSDAIIMLSAC